MKKAKLSKEAFALNVSALSTYTDEISFELGKEIILGADTIKDGLVSVKYGVKGLKAELPLVKNTVYLTVGGCGSFTSSGTTTIAAPQITMYPISSQEGICPKTLKDYFYDLYMADSYNNADNLGKYESVFVDSKIESNAKEINKLVWQGAITSPKYATTTANLTVANGFLQTAYINSASTVNCPKTAITSSNACVVMETILANIATGATAILNECNLYLSPVDFQNTILAVADKFKYNQNLMNSNQIGSFLYPGSLGLTIVRTNGLDGVASGTALATRKDNIWLCISDEEDLEYKIWYSNDYREYRMESSSKIGTGFFQPELVVKIA